MRSQPSFFINGDRIEQVTTYTKYLGTHSDSQLQWAQHVEYVRLRISQRLHFLRRLIVHGVDKSMMLWFYGAAIESIIHYGITTWFIKLSIKLKSQLQNLIKRAGKVIGMLPPSSPQEIAGP